MTDPREKGKIKIAAEEAAKHLSGNPYFENVRSYLVIELKDTYEHLLDQCLTDSELRMVQGKAIGLSETIELIKKP